MRSTFFQQPLEHQIEVEGENWNQGEVLNGKLRIRNMSTQSVTVKTVQIILAYSLKKSIREKTDLAWEIQEKKVLTQNISLSSKEEETFKWSIKLKSDCPISDKLGSLFLLFGDANVLSIGGRLDLKINLHPLLQNFLQTFTTQFRFLEKHQKRKSDWTEIKLIPPESREFPNVESVSCLLRIQDEKLEAIYKFKMQGLGRSGQQMKVTKKNRTIEQTINKENYLQQGGFPNRSYFRDKINEALNIARPEVMF